MSAACRSRGLIVVVTAVVVAAVTAVPASAEVIDWVDFSPWQDGDLSGTGTSAALSVDAQYTLTSGAFDPTRPAWVTGQWDVTDPAYPYDNTDVPNLNAISFVAPLEYSLTFTYTNPGGLPAGGVLAVVDLEQSSTVTITGIDNGMAVPVNWAVAAYEANGNAGPLPTWNAATRTLLGPGTANRDTVVLLVTDRPLDAVRMDVMSVAGDGVGFNTAIPAPGALALLAIAAPWAVGRRRR